MTWICQACKKRIVASKNTCYFGPSSTRACLRSDKCPTKYYNFIDDDDDDDDEDEEHDYYQKIPIW